jgi:hypothetical protein
MPTLSHERLRQAISYSPTTGEFRRKPSGKPAGCIDKDGYRVIRIDGRLYKAGPLAWLYVTGEWPSQIVDHINTDRADDRWDNLRLANRSQNGHNARSSRNNTSGFKGVAYHKRDKRYLAYISVNRKRIHMTAPPHPVVALSGGKDEAWAWYAGRSDEEFTGGPCASRQEAIAEAIGAGDVFEVQDAGGQWFEGVHVIEATTGTIDCDECGQQAGWCDECAAYLGPEEAAVPFGRVRNVSVVSWPHGEEPTP